MVPTTDATSAIGRLKTKPAPKFIRVKETDSEQLAQIAVPEIKRWKGKVATILGSMPWAWIEPLDASGNLLGPRVDNPGLGRATEIEEFEAPIASETNSQGIAALSGMLSLLLKAQDVALVRQRQAYSDVLDNNQKLLAVISDRLGKMEKHAQSSFDVITALHNRLNMEVLENKQDETDDMVAKVLGEVVSSKLGIGGGDE